MMSNVKKNRRTYYLILLFVGLLFVYILYMKFFK